MPQSMENRRGMALALTLVALVIVGALVAGALFAGTEEQRMAENTRSWLQSFGVAEGGAYGAVDIWPANRGGYTGRRAYPLDSAAPMEAAPGSSYQATAYRLNRTLFLVAVTGRAARSGISQRLGMLIRIVPLQPDIHAALTLGEPVAAGSHTILNGADTPPPASNWSDCGPAEDSVAGTRSTPDTAALFGIGSADYATLSRQATVQLPAGTYAPAPVVVGGVCQTSDPENWGDGNDHANPCGGYSPIIQLRGDGTIVSGQGQGALLVDGDLTVNGAFTFYGLIAVRGRLTAAAGVAVTVYGAVSASSADLASGGSMTVNWSSCSVTQALLGAGVAAVGRSRSWVQLY